MEPIKVSVDVNVHLSEKTEQFILGLFSSKSVNDAKPESKPESKQESKQESKPENTASDNISIEDVREALSKKVATHRSEIKEKLTELGAPSVTKLDKSKYSDMLNFLNSLD